MGKIRRPEDITRRREEPAPDLTPRPIPKEVREVLKTAERNNLIFFTIEGMKGRICIKVSS